MDTGNALIAAKEFANILKRKYPDSRCYLFGSFAKQNAHIGSDIDIAVVFKDYNSSFDMQIELMQIRRKIDSRIEPHPFKEADFTIVNPLVYEILTYGKEISL
jgi:uncharacterized protein